MPTALLGRWRRVVSTPVGVAATVSLAVLLLLALLGPLLWGARAESVDTAEILQGSSGDHWFGTDGIGRDIGLRVLVASRLSLGMALLATGIGVGVGLVAGALPAVLGRRLGRLVVAGVDMVVAFPALLLALFFATVFGVGARGAVLAIGLAMAPSFARLTHTLVSSVVDRDYVAAARVAGVGPVRLVCRHVLPNIAEPLVVNATIGAGGALLAFSGLSFLGLGVQAPAYDWGRLLQEGLARVYVAPEAALGPALALVVAGLAFNLAGETLASALGNPTRIRPGSRATRSPAGQTLRATRPATGPGPGEPHDDVLLDVADLRVTFPGAGGPVAPVRGVSLSVRAGEAVGVLGESGSGKSLTALAVTRLLEEPATVSATRLTYRGVDLRGARGRVERELLGGSLAMVFQDPMSSFNPARPVGRQLAEVAEQHHGLGRREALARAVRRLRSVRIDRPHQRARQYPHELSGGMLQRSMIALGLMGEPALIVADEPTTALDVTVQREVLGLLAHVQEERALGLLLISHDVAVVRDVCDRVLVMYAGRIVEELPSCAMTAARHPYTRALLDAVPELNTPRDRPLAVVPGRPVRPDDVPPGCAFADRCDLATDRCRTDEPELADHGAGHRVACWHAGDTHPHEPSVVTAAGGGS